MDFNNVLKRIRPDEKGMFAVVSAFLKQLNGEIKKKKFKAAAIAGGSIAKGTFLKGDHDVDIFIRFDKKYPNEKLSNLAESCLKKWKYERIHGSRDYFNIKIEGLKYEIIPVYDISTTNEAVNITDCSPLHAEWVLNQIAKKPKLRDDIRLTKAFCKAAEVYGAESHIRGFSGHMVDILTIYYGGFEEFLKGASSWKEKQVIDYFDIYKGRTLEMLNKSKIESPLIVVDPIDPGRNASASINKEKFDLFISQAQEFLKHPSEEFFVKKKFSITDIKKKYKNYKVIALDITPFSGKSDIVGSKVVKVLEYLRGELARHDFALIDSNWSWPDEKMAVMWIVVDKKDLEKTMEWEGPPVANKKNVEKFKQKHKKTYVKDEKIYATVQREYVNAEKLAAYLIKQHYVKEKVKKITLA